MLMEKAIKDSLLLKSCREEKFNVSMTPFKECPDINSVSFDPQGFPPGESFEVVCCNMHLEPQFGSDCIADENGSLIIEKDGKNLKDFQYTVSGYMNGETSFMVAVSKKQTFAVAEIFTPNPIEYTWEDGATLKVLMLQKNAEVFIVHFKGFKPHEEIAIVSKTCQETVNGEFNLGESTEKIWLFSPACIDQTGGPISLQIFRSTTREFMRINFLWGTDAIIQSKKDFKAGNEFLKNLKVGTG